MASCADHDTIIPNWSQIGSQFKQQRSIFFLNFRKIESSPEFMDFDKYVPGSLSLSDEVSAVPTGDLPIEGSNRQLVTESPPSPTRSRRCWIATIAIVLVVLLATIIGLAIGLSNSKNSSAASSSVDMAARQTSIQAWVVQQGYSSSESFSDSNSPQSRAAKFMASSLNMDVPNDPTLTESILWMERYVLVVLYYSFQGPTWNWQCNFLEEQMSSCEWNIPKVLDDNYYISQGASCNENSDRISAIEFGKYTK